MSPLLVAGAVSFLIGLLIGPWTIRLLTRLKAGQRVRDDGPKSHAAKSGTPTMGGTMIVFATAVVTLLWAEPRSSVAGHLVVALVGFGLIGLLDDFIKVVLKRSLGLRARGKLLGQLLVALVIGMYALNNLGPEMRIPFTEQLWNPGPVVFLLIAVTAMLGSANAVNITDGLDGLAAGASAIAAGAYALIASKAGMHDAAVFAAALAGACLGFSWYNSHPAQVFMGDTGSLALGGALAALAIVTRTQFTLVIVGGLFVIETLSVMIQVAYFRATGGRRIFRMSPLHHHFELVGWSEPKIVVRFWLIALALGAVGLMSVV